MKAKLSRLPKFVMILVVIVLVAAAALALVFVLNSNDRKPSNANGTTADLSGNNRQNTLNLAEKNTELLNKAINSMLDGSSTASSDKAALDRNSEELGKAIGKLFDKKTEAQFNKYWKAYIDQSFAYAKAIKSKDEIAKNKATMAIATQSSEPLARLIHSINPSVAQDTIQNGLFFMMTNIQQTTELHTQGKMDDEKVTLDQSKSFSRAIFTTIVDGMKKPQANQNKNPQS